MQQQFAADGFGQNLGCTANDVRVAKAINVRDLSGNKITTCNAGTSFNFVADFLVTTSSTSSRSNIGLYMNLQGEDALTATDSSCADNIISPQKNPDLSTHLCAGSSVTCGSTHYDEFDPSPDNCGDSSSSDPTVCLDANNNVVTCGSPTATQTFPATQVVTVEIDNFVCPSAGTTAQLPNCTSWQSPGKTIQCVSPPPTWPFNTNAVPGSPSKCNCETISLPITSQSPQITVAKSCNTTASTGTGLVTCDAGAEGGPVSYTVGITNTSNFGDIIVDQICDSIYGTVFRASTFTGLACGTSGTIPAGNTTCSALDIAAMSTGSCTFKVTQAENAMVTDTLTVSGHGASSGTFGPTSSNSVTVTSEDAPSTATITKGLSTVTGGCEVTRYTVDVKNTSTADEQLSLSALTDNSFGSITALTNPAPAFGQNGVVGTTCGVATGSPGLGTLSGSTGEGALPASLPVGGKDYTCLFDAQICGPIHQVTAPGTCDTTTTHTCTSGGKIGMSCTTDADCQVTCFGGQHTNQVTGTLTGDESEAVTQSANLLTETTCVTPPIVTTSH